MTRTILALAALLTLGCHTRPADAEGSRDLYPSGATGSRANLIWSVDTYGNLLTDRTLIWVYANANEYIEVGSSGMGVGSSDIFIYDPNRVSGNVGAETIPSSADFQASAQAGKGQITSRALELTGPQSADGTGNTTGWAPAYYKAPSSGLYAVVFWGPSGNGGHITDNTPDAKISPLETSSSQGDSVAAWDVTVRDSLASASDLTGRVYVNDLAMRTGANTRLLNSTLYACTTDGYQYRIALNGLDPNNFVIYGNQIGFHDTDGSPLYHDLVGSDDLLTTISGGVSLALPTYPLFFNTPDNQALGAAGVATSPAVPVLTAVSFTGNGGLGGNNSRLGQGGTFSFTSNLSAVYDFVISGDGVNFDPTSPNNRRLRGVRPAGNNTVSWDGKDNSGVDFPVGTNYAVKATIHAGEYHFPLLDAENSLNGGPSITLTNGPNVGRTIGWYDDRGYRTANGNTVGTVNAVLPGTSPPSVAFANPINGYNTTTSQRGYGDGSTNGFGNQKGLDVWTYTPSATSNATLNVQGAPSVLLVKRITAVNGVPISGFADDPGTTTDNSAYWPAPASTYLRGALSGTTVKPGDVVEYTIYFVDTGGPATNVLLCDPLPSNMTFAPDTYTGQTPGDGGAAGAPSGIALGLSASTLPTAPTNFLTNAADAPDRGRFYPPGTQAPAAANAASGYTSPLPAASNLAGVVAVDVAASPTTLPSATGAGTPTGSYGFIRFSARVN